ncbi:MAG: hypothetical protein MUF53_12950, partial [Gemmatimonadaceae bacterium]|nr:hypothetical protein [Gemmatimonadaceae bacterium]
TGTNGGACAGALTHTGAAAGANNALNNNNYTMVYVDVDGDPSTFSSSRSTLAIPVGASVLWAGLYWSGRTDNPLRNTMRFRTPASPGYVTLVADQLDLYTADTPDAYQGFKDVTALVQAGGSGTYVGANVQTTVNTSNQFASWALVVVLRDPSKPLRNLTVFDGFANVSGSSAVNVTVSGFLTPALGTPTTFIGLVTYEGDRGIVGDQMLVNGAVQSNTINAGTNFFNSTVADTTVYRTLGQDPAYTNNVGIDIKTFRTAAVPAGATSALLRFTTTGDQYFPGVVTFQTDLFNPVINGNVVKAVRDRLGNPLTTVVPGDTLRYDITVANTGQDGSINTVLLDTIPLGVTYVPGSMQIVTGSNAGPKSDASGDDQADLLTSPARVRMRLGTGANATTGGALAPNASTRVRFLVRINDSTPAGFLINNQAFVTATAQTLGTPINAASRDSAAAGGTPPTPTPVAGPNLTLSKTHIGDFPRGGTGTYTLTVSNIGTTASSLTMPVVVIDSVPAPAVPTAATGTGWSCSIAGQVVTCSKPGAIAAGASTAPITLTVSVPVTAPGSFTNVARVSGGGDNTPGNNRASDLTVTVGVPDFTLAKTALTSPFVIGSPAQFRLRVRNVGSAANGSDLIVRDTLPAGLTFTAGSGTGFTCAASGQAVTCTRPGAQPVPAGDSVDVVLTVDVAAAASPAVSNTARAENGDDPNPGNNAGTVTGVPVIASVDLALDKSPVGVFTVGQNATWRLRVRAVGPSPAPGPITLTDSLHAGLTFVAASGGGFTCTNAAPLVSCTRAAGLASGDSAIVLLTTLVGAGALPTASNTARVAVAGDANAANDTARVSGVPIVG